MSYNPNNPNGQATMANSKPVVLASNQTAIPTSAASLPLPTGAATSALQTQPGVDIGDVTVNNAAGAAAVNVQDGGNSLTVDGTVAASQSGAWNITNVSGTVSLPTGASTAALQTQPGVDIGDVTVNNAAGAAAVNIQDGGNSITVDGTLASTQSGVWNITNVSGTVSLPTGAATAALQTQPGVDIGDVTVNNASGAAAVNIQDGGNSITVDGTVAATQSGTWTTRITDGTNTATVRDTGSSDSLNVAIVDASGNQITSFGGAGGTSIIDDAAFTVGTTLLTPAGGTYKSTRDAVDDNDAGAFAMTAKRALYTALETPLADSLADDTADALRVIVRDGAGDSCMDDANNALRVNIIAGAGSGGTAMVDDAAFTVGTTNITPAGGLYLSTRDAVTDGDGGALAMTEKRGLYTTLETPNADSAMDDTNDCVKTSVVVALPTGANVIGGVTQSGTWNITNVSGTISLPTGAATAALQTQPGVDIGDVTVNNAAGAAAVNIQDGGNSITIDGTVTANAGSGTFAISAAALPLPSGAATAAKQPALGTAGTASTDVITVQGIASMTALKVDGTGGTFPVSGTIAATQSGAWNITNISGTVSLPTGAATAALQTQPGVDIGDVTVNNAAGASAVNIQDGGNTITVDGTITANAGSGTFSTAVVSALPAGTNAIGKLAANAGVTIGAVEIAAAQTLATVTTVSTVTAVTTLTTLTGSAIAHDAADSGNPHKIGMKAIAHGTNPTAVAAADRTDLYANRAGIPFVIGGHPNIVVVEAAYTGAQTDTAIVTVAGGLKIVVTAIDFVCDNANTVDVGVRIGFGTASTPTTIGVVLSHPGVAPGSGISKGNGGGILGIGADNEDLRITSEAPTTGSCRVVVSYYTIES